MASLKKLKVLSEKLEKEKEKIDTDRYLSEYSKSPFVIVKEFIMDKGLKLYGGQALHMLLEKKNAGFYKKTQLPDYDVFSPDAWNHAKELADLFYKSGFYFVEARASVLNDEHHRTFKVAVDTKFVIDITQAGCTKKQFKEKNCKTCGSDSKGNCMMLFDHIPAVDSDFKKGNMKTYRKIHDNDKNKSLYPKKLFICHPEWLLSSMYRELSEPLSQPDRWPKVATRLELFKKFYDLDSRTCSSEHYNKVVVPKHKPILNTIGRYVKKKSLINYGATAYNFFVKGSKDVGALHVSDYKVYTNDIYDPDSHSSYKKDLISELFSLLKKKYSKHTFKIIEKKSYWKEHADEDTIIMVKDGTMYNSLITFTLNYNHCIPYIQYNGVKFTTIDKLKYLYYKAVSIPEFYRSVENDPLNYRCLLNNLLKVEKKYKSKKKSKFRRFVETCDNEETDKRSELLMDKFQDKMKLAKKTKIYKNKPKKGYITKVLPMSDTDMYIPYYPEEEKIKKTRTLVL